MMISRCLVQSAKVAISICEEIKPGIQPMNTRASELDLSKEIGDAPSDGR